MGRIFLIRVAKLKPCWSVLGEGAVQEVKDMGVIRIWRDSICVAGQQVSRRSHRSFCGDPRRLSVFPAPSMTEWESGFWSQYCLGRAPSSPEIYYYGFERQLLVKDVKMGVMRLGAYV